MLGGAFNQKSNYNFRIETLLPEGFEVFRYSKDQTICSGKKLRFTHAELVYASVSVGFSFSESRPSLTSVENFESDTNGHRGLSAGRIQDVR